MDTSLQGDSQFAIEASGEATDQLPSPLESPNAAEQNTSTTCSLASSAAAVAAAAARARRRRTTAAELAILEDEFLSCDKPDPAERDRIARRIASAEGPGMNGREIQVWFQNKRQAVRRAQGVQMQDGTGARTSGAAVLQRSSSSVSTTASASSNDLLVSAGISHVDVLKKDVPSTSASHAVDAAEDALPVMRVLSNKPRRLASLQLQDLDGHAELVFQPPNEPSPVSPPRQPGLALLTRRHQRQQQQQQAEKKRRQKAARSVSSPALLTERDSKRVRKSLNANGEGPAKRLMTAAAGKENIAPLTGMSQSFMGPAIVHGWQGLLLATTARYLPASPSHLRDVPPSASRDRRVVSAPAKAAAASPAASPTKQLPGIQDLQAPPSSQGTCADEDETEVEERSMSLEECALSLVGLARGS